MANVAITVVVVVIAVIILASLMFACWKGEKVGRKAHLPFRDARRRRKLRTIQAEEEGRYSESWASTNLEPYPVEAADNPIDRDRPTTPPPAYLPRDTTNGTPRADTR